MDPIGTGTKVFFPRKKKLGDPTLFPNSLLIGKNKNLEARIDPRSWFFNNRISRYCNFRGFSIVLKKPHQNRFSEKREEKKFSSILIVEPSSNPFDKQADKSKGRHRSQKSSQWWYAPERKETFISFFFLYVYTAALLLPLSAHSDSEWKREMKRIPAVIL